MTPPPVRIDLGIPMYVHPLEDPIVWRRLAQAAAHVRFAIINVHNGPGEHLDPAYADVLAALHTARVRTIGYVDTAYGTRSPVDCIADARTWVTRYGLRGVFLDQVSSRFEDLEHYADVVLGARAAGAAFVVLNPGTDCHPGYADLANVVVVFEGPWRGYVGWQPPSWCLALPAARFCHLVHDVPWHILPDGPSAAATRHAATVCFTNGRGANPWDRFPAALVESVRGSHPGAVSAPALSAATGQPRRYVVPDASGTTPRAERLTRLRALLRLPLPALHRTPARSASTDTVPNQGDPR